VKEYVKMGIVLQGHHMAKEMKPTLDLCPLKQCRAKCQGSTFAN